MYLFFKVTTTLFNYSCPPKSPHSPVKHSTQRVHSTEPQSSFRIQSFLDMWWSVYLLPHHSEERMSVYIGHVNNVEQNDLPLRMSCRLFLGHIYWCMCITDAYEEPHCVFLALKDHSRPARISIREHGGLILPFYLCCLVYFVVLHCHITLCPLFGIARCVMSGCH